MDDICISLLDLQSLSIGLSKLSSIYIINPTPLILNTPEMVLTKWNFHDFFKKNHLGLFHVNGGRDEMDPHIPSGNLTVCYRKCPFIVDFPITNGDFP